MGTCLEVGDNDWKRSLIPHGSALMGMEQIKIYRFERGPRPIS